MFTTGPLKIQQLAEQLQVGDLVFIRVRTPAFMQVADATGSWTNHVGVVIDSVGTIAESRFPLSGTTSLRRFVRRSAGGRVAVGRLRRPLDGREQQRIGAAARRRNWVFYDTGFDLASRRQFCSRFAREVVQEVTGEVVGDVETFGDLLRAQPSAPLWFWQLWYFGRIPWQRRTVTPVSVLRSSTIVTVFDGRAA